VNLRGPHDHPAARRAAALFGLTLPAPTPEPHATRAPTPAPGAITLITGPSGAGKSTALRRLADRARRTHAVIDHAAITLDDKSCAALLGPEPNAAMHDLAAAGLADARAFIRTPSQLSDGERWRLRLALALRKAGRARKPALLIADEFAALLDRPTARTLARLLRRAATRTNLAVAVATSHDDLAPHLAPDAALRCRLNAPATLEGATPQRPLRIAYREGSPADYDALAPFHYRARRPATIDRVLAADLGADLAAVLVVSRPTLNSPHRDLAWPGRYSAGDKRTRARRLNREIRTISRVVVDPRFRGVGIAARLVARYLRDPLTPCTEAVAVMGALSPFFERAGMTAYTLPPSARNARLADALSAEGLDPADLTRPVALAERASPFLERELRRWAASSGSTERAKDAPIDRLADLARARLHTALTAYAHTA